MPLCLHRSGTTRRLCGHDAIRDARQRSADDRCHPEHPELSDGPTADEKSGTGASRRIHRGVGHGNADQVDESKAETDGDRSESGRGARIRRAEDDHQEHEGHHHLGYERRYERVAAGRVFGVAVRRKATRQVEARLAARDQIENARRDDGAENEPKRTDELCCNTISQRHGRHPPSLAVVGHYGWLSTSSSLKNRSEQRISRAAQRKFQWRNGYQTTIERSSTHPGAVCLLRRAQQVPHSQQVVSGRSEHEHPSDPIFASMP